PLNVEKLLNNPEYLEHLEEEEAKKKTYKESNKVRSTVPKAKDTENILNYYNIINGEWDYSDGLSVYVALRSFDLNDIAENLNLVSSNPTEDMEKRMLRYEKAFENGFKSESGSIGAKLFGALKNRK
ncbi:MAG: hypothetical protein ACRC6B_13160, partial [Fusobacteriaceae bacterium]